MARLTAHVHLMHPVDGALVSLAPGDELPEWAAEQVTNPAVLDSAADEGGGMDVEHGDPEEPPRAGPGSGTDAWRSYATDVLELDVPDDAGRDDIIDLVDATSKTHADLS